MGRYATAVLFSCNLFPSGLCKTCSFWHGGLVWCLWACRTWKYVTSKPILTAWTLFSLRVLCFGIGRITYMEEIEWYDITSNNFYYVKCSPYFIIYKNQVPCVVGSCVAGYFETHGIVLQGRHWGNIKQVLKNDKYCCLMPI